MLVVKNVSKRFGNIIACNDISFTLAKGTKAVILGVNGAGKSTLIKCIVNLLNYDGKITYDDVDINDVRVKKMIGYAPEFPYCYNYLTVEEHLQFIARAYKIKDWSEKAEVLLKRFNMYDKKDKLGKQLSKGMVQKLSICNALITSPRIVILDEPLVGLDPLAIEELFLILEEIASETIVIFSTHIISSVENYWDTALLLNEGNLIVTNEKEATNMSLHDMFSYYHNKK